MVDATITRYATDTVVADYEGPHMKQLRRIILALCHAGYPNRELFMDDNVVLKTYAPGVSLELRFRFQHMLNMSYPFYLKAVGDKIFSMGSPGDTKAFRRMATLLWYYRSPEEGWQPESLITFSLQILTESSENDYFDFYDNDIVKLMGPFNFLTSLSGNLRRGDFPSPVFHERLLQNLGPVIAIYHLWPHYSSSGFFASLREVLDSYASLEGSRRWNIWEAGLHILMRITDQAPVNEGASPLIRHFDVVELMARSSILYVQTDTTKVDHNTCLKIIEDYTRIAEALHLRAGKNTLRKAFRQAARREWYPTLKVLRELPLRDRRTLPKCTKLIPAWQDLGRALGLDEANEKADFEREMKKAAQMCAWFECEYHEKKPPHPTRACVGCAEARYCSRLCQQKDWREGGHKQKCKRIKSEPHQPRGES
ncbi:hypothetical protein PENSPDRAFT_486919 [Peniophora sp. CONT]|nr:hypothetical protein PENSPDRAFT_486919 [Peniophora sp. CONT]